MIREYIILILVITLIIIYWLNFRETNYNKEINKKETFDLTVTKQTNTKPTTLFKLFVNIKNTKFYLTIGNDDHLILTPEPKTLFELNGNNVLTQPDNDSDVTNNKEYCYDLVNNTVKFCSGEIPKIKLESGKVTYTNNYGTKLFLSTNPDNKIIFSTNSNDSLQIKKEF